MSFEREIAALDSLIAEATELRRASYPDEITDDQGRVWTWLKGDLYTTPMPHLGEGYRAAWPVHFIPRGES